MGHIYAAVVFKLSHTVPSNLHFTHITKSIVSVSMHRHSCGLTSLALPPLGKLPFPGTFHGHLSAPGHHSNEPSTNMWGQGATSVTHKYNGLINQLFFCREGNHTWLLLQWYSGKIFWAAICVTMPVSWFETTSNCFSPGNFEAGRQCWSVFNCPDNAGWEKGNTRHRWSSWSCLTELNEKCTMLTNIAAFLLQIFQ